MDKCHLLFSEAYIPYGKRNPGAPYTYVRKQLSDLLHALEMEAAMEEVEDQDNDVEDEGTVDSA